MQPLTARTTAALLGVLLLTTALSTTAAASRTLKTGPLTNPTTNNLAAAARRLHQTPDGCSQGSTPAPGVDCFNGVIIDPISVLPDEQPLPNNPTPGPNPGPAPGPAPKPIIAPTRTCATRSGKYTNLFGVVKPAPCLLFCWAYPTVKICECKSATGSITRTWGACKA